MTFVSNADAKVWYHLMRGRTCVVHASGCEILPAAMGGRACEFTTAQLKALVRSRRGKARLALASGATGAAFDLASFTITNPAQNWVNPEDTRQLVTMWRDAGSKIQNSCAEGLLGRCTENICAHGTVVLTPVLGSSDKRIMPSSCLVAQ